MLIFFFFFFLTVSLRVQFAVLKLFSRNGYSTVVCDAEVPASISGAVNSVASLCKHGD